LDHFAVNFKYELPTPVAEAGDDVAIHSPEQVFTVIEGSATDPYPGPEDLDYRWLEGETVLQDWADVGTGGEASLSLAPLPTFEVGDHVLTLEVTDTVFTVSDTVTLTIENTVPAITEITIAPTPLGEITTVTASFTDPDVEETHTATIDWGDGTESPGSIDEETGTITGSHPTGYAAAGVYTVTVTVEDDNGGVSQPMTAYAAVYDPESCNLVTGAGWFDEELGGPCGKAFFGFVVRQIGGNDPVGRMRFRWGENRFRATQIDWLVVEDGGASAWFAGVGTINDAGSHDFVVEVGEDPEEIWITIADQYDNEGLQAIDRGRVRVRQWGG
jgi:hypothetical protein